MPIALFAGMPANILCAYVRFLENIVVFNAYATGLGAPRRRVGSIPQGCPFSMRILALITRPWCELVRLSGVIPRVLADDLMMLAIQQQAAWRTARALLDSHGYIIAMGGQVRVNKTWTFASEREGRNVLKLLILPGQEDELVPMVFEHRDLGGHLDATARRTGTTLTQRLVKTTGQCKAHAQTPGGFTQRYRLVMGKYLPMALYGASTCLENCAELNKLSAAFIGMLMGRPQERDNTRRAVVLALYAYSTGPTTTADPLHAIFARRAPDLRRAWFKMPHLRHTITYLLREYHDRGMGGAQLEDAAFGLPMPRGQVIERKRWMWPKRPTGPVGILLQTCLQRNAAVSTDGVLTSGCTPPIHLFRDPVQFVKRVLYRVSEGAAFHVVATNRRAFGGIKAVDRGLTTQTCRTIPTRPTNGEDIDQMQAGWRRDRAIRRNKDRAACIRLSNLPDDYERQQEDGKDHPKAPLLWCILAGDLWTPQISHKAGFLSSPICPFCGHPVADQFHLMRKCTAFAAGREADPRLRQLVPTPDALPRSLAELGWAPAPHADPTGPYWGRDLAPTDDYANGVCGTQTLAQLIAQGHDSLMQAVHDGDIPNTTAECFIDQLRGHTSDDAFPPMSHVGGQPDKQPDTYTDGSVRNPAHPFCSSGTFAVYHRGRNLCDEPPTEVETTTSRSEQDIGHGTTHLCNLQGHMASSNRTEAAGVLLALVRPRPLHLAVDNALAVKTLRSILLGQSRPATRPWAMRDNGDI